MRIQFERNSLVGQYPKVSSRNKHVVKRIQDLKDMVKKLGKGRPIDDPLKLPFRSEPPMSAVERMKVFRMKKTAETKENEQENDRKRKGTREEKEKTKLRVRKLRS